MIRKRILVCGDSFAVDHNRLSNRDYGWPSILSQHFDVTNLAQAGIGEYKIAQQIKTACLSEFDCVIVSHTSPNRVHINRHPVHTNSKIHSNADLIYSDIIWHLEQHPTNQTLLAAKKYFTEIYDQDYYEYIYRLIQQDIVNTLRNHKTLHLTTLYNKNTELFDNYLDLQTTFEVVPGEVNHYSKDTNQKVFNLISQWICQNV